MSGGGIPEWFGKDQPPPPRRGGGSPKLPLAIVVLLIGAGAGAFVVLRPPDPTQNVTAQQAEEQRAQREAEAKRRLEAEMKAAAEATPEPVVPDPSDLPSIEDVLAEDAEQTDAEAAEAEAAEGDAAPAQRDAAQVLSVVNARRKDVRGCYAAELRLNPSAGGRVDVTLTIAPDGRVTAAQATSTGTLSADVRTCIVRVMRTARFSPAADTATVKVPFVFNAP